MMTTRLIVGSVLLMTCFVERLSVAQAVTADDVARGIFMGQAYVSGNVYLKAFGAGQLGDWPEAVVATRLNPPATQGSTPRLELTFSHVVNASGSGEYSNFPLTERAPGEDEFNRPPDIFRTVLDSALEDRDIGVYRTRQPIPGGFTVLAWRSDLSLDAVNFRNSGNLRPMTNAEKMEVANSRKEAGTRTKDYECTTEPGFLDSATEILRSSVKGTGFSIRISEYSNPGCAGHLEDVYVLDVWEDGKEPSRFEWHHYVGAI